MQSWNYIWPFEADVAPRDVARPYDHEADVTPSENEFDAPGLQWESC